MGALALNIKLYGTLSRSIDSYDHSGGLDLSMPEGSTALDLLKKLRLENESIGMIFMNNRPVKKQVCLTDKAQIKVFQPIFGG